MKAWMIIGVILIVVGAVGLIYGGITYSSHTSTLDFGGVKIQADQKHQIPLPPIVSGVVLVAGVIVVLVGRRKRSV